ncbi:MAG: hypothetical protein WD737_01505 [Gemmatimonadota bacterium]
MTILERVFQLRQHQTSVRTELEAELTTFLTMAYILVVNPLILAEAGVPFEGALFGTAVGRRSCRPVRGAVCVFGVGEDCRL